MGQILFFSEDTTYRLKHKIALRIWIKDTAESEGFRVGDINVVICSDAYLLAINRQYLQHDTFTDIVTFDHSDREGVIAGDVFISIDRIHENATKFGVTERDELHRVIIHGILHLCGYRDKKKAEKAQMTEKEDFYLARRAF
ncbi:rRNA maturation RNase YbeY [Parapedobacter sp. ISTM3]|uniref:rRNA maturation RNase YbeY n=1 Tax=Parapedobacter sp. ISTM3 TaxID=2800130 RepID=UPI001905B7DB|nr:rRNA maturation RNase YbeY [Parapedobacter sp. ISTM3]MBK1442160.1 rRNA maturation RNase YbeY [Parapedobacter sp. ISTM3]